MISYYTDEMDIRVEGLNHLRQNWPLYAYSVFNPRCTSADLLLTLLSLIFSKGKNAIEYGPFTGQTSFFMGTVLDLKNEELHLVDNWQQTSLLKYYKSIDFVQSTKQVLKSSIEYTGFKNYTLHELDVIESNPSIKVDAGFVLWDINYGEDIEKRLELLANDLISKNKPVILAIDDTLLDYNSNTYDFKKAFWKNVYPNISKDLKLYCAGGNRIYLSNYEMDEKFFGVLKIFAKYKLLDVLIDCNPQYYSLPTWQATRKLKTPDFWTSDLMWKEIKLLFSKEPRS